METLPLSRISSNGAARKETGNKAPKSRKQAARHKAMVPAAPRLALGITVGMGVSIPALTLGLSTVAGRLATHGYAGLAGFAVTVGATVLMVSLSHLAWAIGDITRSPSWASWLLAIAVDLSIVLSESVHVFAPGVVDSLATAIMVAVTLASMALNVWAFLRHR
jgi:hypothetical protein